MEDVDLKDESFIIFALKEAQKAFSLGEVPVGAVAVLDDEIVGRGYNTREYMNDPLGHAEIAALSQASEFMKNWRLEDVTLYVTLEPCIMCAGAVLAARVRRLVFGASDFKGGAVRSLYRLLEDSRINHQVLVRGGVLEGPCQKILKNFFSRLRIEKKRRSSASPLVTVQSPPLKGMGGVLKKPSNCTR